MSKISLMIGDKIRPRIDASIRLNDKLLLVLSQHSVAGQWVEQEVETELEKERKEARTVLFPIRLDEAVSKVKGGWPTSFAICTTLVALPVGSDLKITRNRWRGYYMISKRNLQDR